MNNLQPAVCNPPLHADEDVLVRVEGVGKKFCRDLKKSLLYGVRDIAGEAFGMRSTPELRPQEFWAVDGVSFELRRGECLGLIGRNGAGKTTLLKMLNGLIKPDRGRIEMRGRVGALIALGAGFNPVLTGRENVYVNAAVLGLNKKEIDAKFDEIVDFADLGDFIDTPVQSYSSGMQVRLGFAVTTALQPDVLLVDEVLAVGDTAFRIRCYNRIRDLLPHAAVIFVSHNMFDVARTCTRCMVLGRGRVRFSGNVQEGIHAYSDANWEDVGYSGPVAKLETHVDKAVETIHLRSFEYVTEDLDTRLKLEVELTVKEELGPVRVRVVFFDESEYPAAEWDSTFHDKHFHLHKGICRLEVDVERIRLMSGYYRVAFVVTNEQNTGYYANIDRGLTMRIKNKAVAGAVNKI
jgi:lipopolysaccharide transport system ATP-binding protein